MKPCFYTKIVLELNGVRTTTFITKQHAVCQVIKTIYYIVLMMEMEYTLTVTQAIVILEKGGLQVTEREAKLTLDFLHDLAERTVHRYFDNEDDNSFNC